MSDNLGVNMEGSYGGRKTPKTKLHVDSDGYIMGDRKDWPSLEHKMLYKDWRFIQFTPTEWPRTLVSWIRLLWGFDLWIGKFPVLKIWTLIVIIILAVMQ